MTHQSSQPTSDLTIAGLIKQANDLRGNNNNNSTDLELNATSKRNPLKTTLLLAIDPNQTISNDNIRFNIVADERNNQEH